MLAVVRSHDDDPPGAWSRDELLEIFQMKGCATPRATSFNHSFLVGNSLRLFFFDSHGGVNTSKDGVTREAIAAFEALSETPEMRAEKAAGVKGLAFFHIPLAEFADPAARIVAGRISAMDAARPKGFTGRMVGCPGWEEHSATGRPLVNTGLYQAIQRQQNISACFVGHDHFHDAVLKRPDAGPYLCWGRVTSFTPPADFEGLIPVGCCNFTQGLLWGVCSWWSVPFVPFPMLTQRCCTAAVPQGRACNPSGACDCN